MQEVQTKPVKKEREYLFDNYKVLLIIMVVMGHFIEPCCDSNSILYELKWMIVSVHMPAFIFISGYFSKKEPSLKKLLNSLVIPYFVYEIMYYLLYTLFLHKHTGLYFTRPKFTLWYLMALFVWKVITPYVKKIPFYFGVAVLLGLLVGFTDIDNFLTIPRIMFFYPFFLAGTEFDIEIIKSLRDKKHSIAAGGIIGAAIAWLFIDKSHHQLSMKIFYGRQSYDEIGLNPVNGVLIRLACYLISFTLIYLLMFIMPTRKHRYSYVGQRTMPIYIFHGMVYSVFEYGTDILQQVRGEEECFILLAGCVALVWLLAQRPFVQLTNQISNVIR